MSRISTHDDSARRASPVLRGIELVVRGIIANGLLGLTLLAGWCLWLVILVVAISTLVLGIGFLLLPVVVVFGQVIAFCFHSLLSLGGVRMPEPPALPQMDLKNWASIKAAIRDQQIWRVCLFSGVIVFPMMIISIVVGAVCFASFGVLFVLPFTGLNEVSHLVLVGYPVSSPWMRLAFLITLVVVSGALSPLLIRGFAFIYRLVICANADDWAIARRVEVLEQSRRDSLGEESRQLRALERNLHDGPQQLLVRVGMDLSLAQRRLATGEVDSTQQAIMEARQHTQAALEQMRALVRGFAPPVLAERGLADALAVLAANAPIETTIASILPSGWRIDPTVEQALYFVASEAIANAGKYSGATHIDLVLDEDGGRLRLWVRDNGRGGAKLLPGHGLEGISGRAKSIDGELKLISDSRGTQVMVVCADNLRWRQ